MNVNFSLVHNHHPPTKQRLSPKSMLAVKTFLSERIRTTETPLKLDLDELSDNVFDLLVSIGEPPEHIRAIITRKYLSGILARIKAELEKHENFTDQLANNFKRAQDGQLPFSFVKDATIILSP